MKLLLPLIVILTSSHVFAQTTDAVVRGAPVSSDGWLLTCGQDQCNATSGLVSIVCRGAEFSLHTLADFEVQHWHNRTAQPLKVGTPLDAFERETLFSGGQLVLIDPLDPTVAGIAGTSLDGLSKLLSQTGNAPACDLETNPMGYRALLDDPAYAGQDQLVPFTKPQVEFAVRAQTADVD